MRRAQWSMLTSVWNIMDMRICSTLLPFKLSRGRSCICENIHNTALASMPLRKVAMALSLLSWLVSTRPRLRDVERGIVGRLRKYSKLEIEGSDLPSLISPYRR